MQCQIFKAIVTLNEDSDKKAEDFLSNMGVKVRDDNSNNGEVNLSEVKLKEQDSDVENQKEDVENEVHEDVETVNQNYIKDNCEAACE